MRTYLDCLTCIVDQAIKTMQLHTDDEQWIKQKMDDFFPMMREVKLERTPPENGMMMYNYVAQVTGNPDLFRKVKQENTRKALELYPYLKERVETASDPLLTAVRIAIAGNIIDYGANRGFDLEKDVERVLQQDFARLDVEPFREQVEQAKQILYIGDNAGETVFDRVLIETMGKPTVFAVRERPIINDATREEAQAAGLHRVARIISSGSPVPGTPLNLCNREFLELFHTSDVVIAKGQGNYETLSDAPRPIFLMFQVKCHVIARHVGMPKGSIVLWYQS